MNVSQTISGNQMIISTLTEEGEKFWNIFNLLNADVVWVVPNPKETVCENERAVIVRFSNRDEPGWSGLWAKIDIHEIRTVLSLTQEAALFSQDYGALNERELKEPGRNSSVQRIDPDTFF
jgi:hypothetical protein